MVEETGEGARIRAKDAAVRTKLERLIQQGYTLIPPQAGGAMVCVNAQGISITEGALTLLGNPKAVYVLLHGKTLVILPALCEDKRSFKLDPKRRIINASLKRQLRLAEVEGRLTCRLEDDILYASPTPDPNAKKGS